MQNPTHGRQVREWLVSLGVLTAISISQQEAEMKLAAYVPMLADQFPVGAFTKPSLEFVAARCIKGFPTYSELRAHLSVWWRDNRPYIALPAPPPEQPRDPVSEEAKAAVAKTTAEAIAWLRARDAAKRETARASKPRHLTPEQLDQLVPLPNGRKRADAARTQFADADDGAASLARPSGADG